MRKYELALVFNDTAGSQSSRKKFLTELLTPIKGKLEKFEVVGLRDLAYPIKGKTRGWYGFGEISVEEDKINELDKAIKLKDDILRYLLIRRD
ncbi:MAG: 30S ribosomal protein S6 [Candidatus Beckwithbacteria bacterium GW2011_GWB1_47_15]|uniref:Small ribosomal subunit protein bS6 n=1 Tax=Candidatus Beckwithbacteria bacterium GW2011_GWB1_47_15 TaxID=1618371 RepID=A0A0G1RWA1_9BACT|nr:MAG: 30S ribosomal protein S6 [Candidatus Beckwithbacteria bacterium GW2011_GWC1_49_16]KKU35327.1 MAG: 30S ribosomal protein S6 [Candidatus Beckwithbacteria bacterium GW2011_GWA1_46_30]KKU61422.1 MAG: 30S ribosomal protein S6 [Candidatus Beckwithbacteria bacterium GW2011_GWB1_47_15]KKU71829.1 MAG: 30S ribosomal protein S6 [Candidatus Beckwithbacteria bacterium GW2011_GWA2_47_25]KKW03723.1 MAG: 30S ribosomal protein S6 [Candidatus Beckwithbacteria bacterium GW2011_GWC2_49_11]OGD48774.1 MAG: 